MRVLYVTAEIFPLAKVGGLADVSAALPVSLRDQGIDVRLLLPGYPRAMDQAANLRIAAVIDDLLGVGQVRIWKGKVPGGAVPLLLVECPSLFSRAGNPYQDEQGCDFVDNGLRFGLLGHIGAMVAAGEAGLPWRPDLVHVNDWHTALLPLMLRVRPEPQPPTLLAIHNLAYKGAFPADVLQRLAVPAAGRASAAIDCDNQVSFLKAGICAADQIVTVSPTYATEILTAEYGCGLDELLRSRSTAIHGILNGADYDIWDPACDPYLTVRYDPRDLSKKQACKSAVQEEMGLAVEAEVPLVGFTSRLVWQKMPEIVLEALTALLSEGIQFALVGEGDRGHEAKFRELAAAYPGRVGVRIGYQETIAHRLLAGADMILNPARYEPCGLTAIYGMRYGTPPIARRTGGIIDTVVDAQPQNVVDGSATGFLFNDVNANEMVSCVRRALQLYRQKTAWHRIQIAGMRRDFGWARSARQYADLYRQMTEGLSLPIRLRGGNVKRRVVQRAPGHSLRGKRTNIKVGQGRKKWKPSEQRLFVSVPTRYGRNKAESTATTSSTGSRQKPN